MSLIMTENKSEILMISSTIFLGLSQEQDSFISAFYFIFDVVSVLIGYLSNSFAPCSNLLI